MGLAGNFSKDERVKQYILCKLFKCLPSQLDKEDSKAIEEIVIINNEMIAREEDRVQQIEAEARLKGMM